MLVTCFVLCMSRYNNLYMSGCLCLSVFNTLDVIATLKMHNLVNATSVSM